MENEMYTFVVLTHEGHRVEYRHCNRADADRHFDATVRLEAKLPEGLTVAYYCASVGGLVNAWHAEK